MTPPLNQCRKETNNFETAFVFTSRPHWFLLPFSFPSFLIFLFVFFPFPLFFNVPDAFFSFFQPPKTLFFLSLSLNTQKKLKPFNPFCLLPLSLPFYLYFLTPKIMLFPFTISRLSPYFSLFSGPSLFFLFSSHRF